MRYLNMFLEKVLLPATRRELYLNIRDASEIENLCLAIPKDWLYWPSLLLYVNKIECDENAYFREEEREKRGALLSRVLVALKNDRILEPKDHARYLIDEAAQSAILNQTKKDEERAKKEGKLSGRYIFFGKSEDFEGKGYRPDEVNIALFLSQQLKIPLRDRSWYTPIYGWKSMHDARELAEYRILSLLEKVFSNPLYTPALQLVPEPKNNEDWKMWERKVEELTWENYERMKERIKEYKTHVQKFIENDLQEQLKLLIDPYCYERVEVEIQKRMGKAKLLVKDRLRYVNLFLPIISVFSLFLQFPYSLLPESISMALKKFGKDVIRIYLRNEHKFYVGLLLEELERPIPRSKVLRFLEKYL